MGSRNNMVSLDTATLQSSGADIRRHHPVTASRKYLTGCRLIDDEQASWNGEDDVVDLDRAGDASGVGEKLSILCQPHTSNVVSLSLFRVTAPIHPLSDDLADHPDSPRNPAR